MKTLALKPWQWCLVAAIAVLFFLFVWPTPYQIYKHPKGTAYRVNRFNGVMEVSTENGWKRGYVNSAGMYRSGN
jgi:hypothetical protein